MPKHFLPDVVKDFSEGRFPERAELIKEFREAMEHPNVKMLVAEIGQRAVEKNSNPAQVIGLGIMYGCVLGVLSEKYRRKEANE